MKPIKSIYGNLDFLGIFFLITALILFIGERFSKPKLTHSKSIKEALIIGCWQALAIIPGISRSGATISGARLLGWNIQDAIQFSFLLSIPTISGGIFLEVINGLKNPENVESLPITHYLIGFFISFLVGLCALKLLMFIALKHKFSYFAWYCLFLGIATTYYFHI